MFFYADELDHYGDTARSLILAELKTSAFTHEIFGAEVQLWAFVKRLEQNAVSANELADFTLSKFIKIVVDDLTESASVLGESQDILTKDIQSITATLNKSELFARLIKNIQNLGNAVLHKQDYLAINAKILNQNEAGHRGNWFGDSRLILAIKRGEMDRVQDFIDRRLYCNAVNSIKQTPLMLAAEKGLDSIVKLLLPISDVEAKSTNSQTALFYAVKRGHQSSCNLLISAGARTDWIIRGLNKSIEQIASERNIKLNNFPPAVNSVHVSQSKETMQILSKLSADSQKVYILR